MPKSAFVGRSREIGRIRAALDAPTSSILRVTGLRGGGKSALVARALEGRRAVIHVCPPLPDTDQRSALWGSLGKAIGGDASDTEAAGHRGRSDGVSTAAAPPPDWPDILRRLDAAVASSDRPLVLVLDDAHRLREARSRIVGPLVDVLGRARAGPPLHVVLVGGSHALPDAPELDPLHTETVAIGPLPLRAAAPFLPGDRPIDKLTAYGVFGGIPRVLRALDPAVTTGTNLRRLVFDRSGALADAGAAWLERDLQTPPRYYAIMSALSAGVADWSTVHAGLPDLTKSGQVAPYMTRLSELGLLRAHRSLDAPPKSRSTRYLVTDPFLAFWFRWVLPFRASSGESEGAYHARVIRPSLDGHLESVFPFVCRQHMLHDAMETLGANAREIGGLWGDGYDLPVAGLLSSGAAFYGACAWSPGAGDRGSPLTTIERAKRESRYGFGRERRLSLVFTGHRAPATLRREVARPGVGYRQHRRACQKHEHANGGEEPPHVAESTSRRQRTSNGPTRLDDGKRLRSSTTKSGRGGPLHGDV